MWRFFSSNAYTVVPRSTEHIGSAPLISRPAVVLAMRKEGLTSLETYVHHTTISQWVRIQNTEVMDLLLP